MHPLIENLESTPDTLKRIKAAASAELTPVSVDTDAKSACFVGHNGKYTTTLDSCQCKDYILRQKPCKHIYRLAHELGVLNIPNVVSDVSKIPSDSRKITSVQRRKATDYCIGAINAAGEASARALQEVLAYRNATATKRKPCPRSDIADLQPFFAAGILQMVEAPELILTAFGKKATVDALIAAGYIFPCDLKKTISVRFDYALRHASVLQPIVCPEWAVVEPANQLIAAETKVYQYLNQLFPQEIIFYV